MNSPYLKSFPYLWFHITLPKKKKKNKTKQNTSLSFLLSPCKAFTISTHHYLSSLNIAIITYHHWSPSTINFYCWSPSTTITIIDHRLAPLFTISHYLTLLPLSMTIHHHLLSTIVDHRQPSLITIDYHSSPPIIIGHHPPSFFTVSHIYCYLLPLTTFDHHLLLLITVYHHLSLLTIIHHCSSPLITIRHYWSSPNQTLRKEIINSVILFPSWAKQIK